MAAAGQSSGIKGLDFMVREVAIFKLWSQAIQAMLQRDAQHRMQSAHGGRIRYGSPTPRAAISTWRSGPSYRHCSIPPTTSTPGTARTARRTIRSGTTRNSRPCRRRSTGKSMPKSARI